MNGAQKGRKDQANNSINRMFLAARWTANERGQTKWANILNERPKSPRED